MLATGCQIGKHHGGGGGGSTLVSITITPASPSVQAGLTLQLSGYGTLSNGSQVQNNGLATWASSNTAVATIDPSSALVTGITPGTSVISATYQGITGQATLTVTAGSGVHACGSGSGYESLLSGQWAFLLNGFDDAGHAEVLAGSITADGAGNITGGEEDANNVAVGASHVVISASGSTYTLGSDYRGCLVLGGSTSVTFSFALSASGTKGRIIEFDDSTGSGGTRLAGILRLQDTSSFALAQLQPNYAFGIHGWDASQKPFAAAGSFSNNSGTLSNGFADLNDGGTIAANLTAITGTISSISNASGRGSMTYGPGGQTLDFSIYMVSALEFLAVGVDPIANAPITSGQAIATANSFNSASLAGPYMFATSGYSASTVGGDVTIGTLNFDGVSTAQGTLFEDKAGTSTSNPVNGTYSIDATSGRVTLASVGNHSPVVYLTNSTDGIAGFIVGTDNSASSGVSGIQSGGPFSSNSLSGNYIAGTTNPPDATTGNYVGVISFTSGIASGTENLSKSGASGLVLNQAISQTYTINADGTGNGGTNTAAVTNGSTVFFVDETPGKDPEIVVIEQ